MGSRAGDAVRVRQGLVVLLPDLAGIHGRHRRVRVTAPPGLWPTPADDLQRGGGQVGRDTGDPFALPGGGVSESNTGVITITITTTTAAGDQALPWWNDTDHQQGAGPDQRCSAVRVRRLAVRLRRVSHT